MKICMMISRTPQVVNQTVQKQKDILKMTKDYSVQ